MLTQQQRHAGLTNDQIEQVTRAESALKEHRLRDAAQLCASLAARAAGHPEILRLQGTLAYLRGDAAGALEPLVAALRQRPGDALVLSYLGASYERLGDMDNALKAFRQACEKAPERLMHWVNFGGALARDGWQEHAAAILQHALKMDPRHHEVRSMLASALSTDGKADLAVEQYRRVLEDVPSSGAAWWGLALLKPMPLKADDIVQMRAQLAREDLGANDRIALEFALAHTLEHGGDFAGAFAALQRAHGLASQQQQPWDAAASRALTQRCLDAVPAATPAQPDDLGREVIFIASLPRSGSTLVEQILASHSQVAGTIELRDLSQTLSEYSDHRQMAYPEWVSSLTPNEWRALGRRYLQRTARWRNERPRMTDKALVTWRHIGAVLSMLPNARVVVVQRDPLETCLACYRMWLHGHDYTHTFEDLANSHHQFDLAVHEWQRRYPQRVRIQAYEDLTRDPDQQIHELLDFCDLPFEQACIDFHTTKRRVSTLSAAQVRQPVYRARKRAELYGTLLDPLRAALAERAADRDLLP